MNNEQTSPAGQSIGKSIGTDEQTAPSVNAFGTHEPGTFSDTDMTAIPSAGSSTDVGAGMSAKPSDVNAATITAMSSSVVNLFGQYELLGEVARGGMGVVYRARQRGLDRLVALKMVLGISGDHDANLQRFMIEAKAAASLDHPNVVPIYDCGEVDNKLYFTMALVEGPNLKAFVESNGLPSIPHTISLFAQIVAGVAHAHGAGIIHRDLKPANVLMDKDGRPRVTDFGLAKKASGNSELTGTGQIMGTPAYMPPEQARDSKDVGPPADVYSLGAILYYLLTGRPPFIGESVPDLLIKVVSENPDPPSTINPDVPPDLEALCLRCLAKSAGERFADARELAEAMLPIVDAYLPRSSHSLHSMGRTSGSITNPGSRPLIGGTTSLITATQAPSIVEPPPAKKKGPVIALSVVAGVLAAAALYLLVFAPPKPIDDGKGGIAKINPVQPGKETPGQVHTPVTPEDVEWPALGKSDFTLNTVLVGSGAKDASGVLQLKPGTDIKLKLTAEKDCQAAVFWFDPNGTITLLFPNEFNKDNRLKAGEERIIPGDNQNFVLTATPTQGSGPELMRVVATTGLMPQLPHGTTEGHYTSFKSKEEIERVASFKRGIAIRQKSTGTTEGPPQVAETEIKFRVNP